MTIENKIAVLGSKLEHIDAAIAEMNKNVDIILEKLNQQNGDLIKAEKDIEYLKEEIKENKLEHKEEISILWSELRRRDKKTMWILTTAISAAVLIMAALNLFV